MRSACCLLLAGLLCAANVGCIGIVSNKKTVRLHPLRTQAVVVDGQIYLVDVADGAVRKIEREALMTADIVRITEIEVMEETPVEP